MNRREREGNSWALQAGHQHYVSGMLGEVLQVLRRRAAAGAAVRGRAFRASTFELNLRYLFCRDPRTNRRLSYALGLLLTVMFCH